MTTFASRTAAAALRPQHTAALLLAAGAVLAFAQAIPGDPARGIVVLPVALLAPGYAVTVAVMGRRGPSDPASTLVLSAILSVALYPLLALVLYVLGVRLGRVSVLTATEAVLVGAVAVVALREALGRSVPRSAAGMPPLAASSRDAFRIRGATGIAVAGTVACGLVALSLHVLPEAKPAVYSEIHLSGRWAGLQAPVTAPRSGRLEVAIAVTNRSRRAKTYLVWPTVAGARREVPQVLRVQAGRARRSSVNVQVSSPKCLTPLVIDLYEASSRRFVSSVNVWLAPRGAAARTRSVAVRCRGGA